MPRFSPSNRNERTWWTALAEASGLSVVTVYNRRLLPVAFAGIEEDCAHLKRAVQIWDVGCERQVRITGPDAHRLMQRLTPRDLDRVPPDRLAYVPVCAADGGMLGDPVAMPLPGGGWQVSAADCDLRLWAEGVAEGAGMDVRLDDPGTQLLALQGPEAATVACRVLGADLADLPAFGIGRVRFAGTGMVVTRSGYSHLDGFEIHVPDETLAVPLWQALAEAGRAADIRAGCPNAAERIEGGMLSYGNDMTRDDTPFDAGLGAFVERFDCIGGAALRTRPRRRRIAALALEGHPPECDREWPVTRGGRRIGRVRSAAWSAEFGCGVAIAMVEADSPAGDGYLCLTQEGPLGAHLRDAFWR